MTAPPLREAARSAPAAMAGLRRVRIRSHRSSPEAADGLDAADDVTAGVRRVGLADVGQGLGVTEDRDCLLELSEVIWTDDDGGIVTVVCDDHSLMLVFNAIDDLGQVVADGPQWFGGRHGHNCGAPYNDVHPDVPTADPPAGTGGCGADGREQ